MAQLFENEVVTEWIELPTIPGGTRSAGHDAAESGDNPRVYEFELLQMVWLTKRARAAAIGGTGTGIRTPVPWLRTTCPDP